MAGVKGKEIYLDKPFGVFKKCADLCGQFPKACLEYCPDYTQSHSGEVSHTGVHETWQLIFIGVGLFVLIPIVAVVYMKRTWFLDHLKKCRGGDRAPDDRYPDEETGYVDQTRTLLYHYHYTGDQSCNDLDTGDSSSKSLDTGDQSTQSSRAEQVLAVIIEPTEPTAPPEEASSDDNSHPEEEMTGGSLAARDSIDEPLPTPSQLQIELQDIRIGGTIREHDVSSNPNTDPVGSGKQNMYYQSNVPLRSMRTDTTEIKTHSNTNRKINSEENGSQSSISSEVMEITSEAATDSSTLCSPNQANESVNGHETVELAHEELEHVLSTQPTETNYANESTNLTSFACGDRRVDEDCERGISSEAANTKADTAIDMARSDKSLADTEPAEKQVMPPRHETEDTRQEVR